jgi:hypothetical protein
MVMLPFDLMQQQERNDSEVRTRPGHLVAEACCEVQAVAYLRSTESCHLLPQDVQADG